MSFLSSFLMYANTEIFNVTSTCTTNREQRVLMSKLNQVCNLTHSKSTIRFFVIILMHNVNADEKESESLLLSSLSGGASAGIAKTCTAPLERVRIIRQASDRGKAGSISLVHSIYYQEGLRGLWKGNAVNLMRIVPSYAVRFGTFGHLSQYEMLNNPFIAGSLSGLVSALASYPLDSVRTRLSVHGNLWDAIRTGRMYAGCSLTVVETMPYAGLTLGTYKYLGEYVSSNDPWTKVINGLVSGFVATTACFPLDTLRRSKMVRPNESIALVLKSLVAEGAVSRLYRGISVALLKSPPTVAITMILNDWFLGKLT